MSQTTLPSRNEVPLGQTWDLTTIFPTDEAWEAAYKQATEQLPLLSDFQGKLGDGPETILECFQVMEDMLISVGKVLIYSNLASSVDVGDQPAAARAGQGRSLFAKLQAVVAFIQPELMSIGFDNLRQWMLDEPEMKFLAHYIDSLERQRAHVRPAEVEEVLALATDIIPGRMPPSAYSSLVNVDLKFEPAVGTDGAEMEVGQSSIGSLITHPDREIRRTAWENYADAYLKFKNTLADIQIMGIKRDVFNMRTRKYGSSLESALNQYNIHADVFHNLIEVFKQNLPTWHRYWRIRRKALGYEKFHVYDIKAPLMESKPAVSYDQAVTWISEGMAPLGEEYVGALQQGSTTERWVDHSRNKGKRQGAFSSGFLGTNPFIMMSYADDLFSLSTLAHELGHSMHRFYTNKVQPLVYEQYSIFAAEVASNFNQAMVRDHLFRTQTEPAFQMALIEEAMSNYHRYFFIMPTLARFELEIHERIEKGAPVNTQSLINLTADLFKEGYGDEVEFDHERIGITWAQFGHMYMNFYVYQYATGISGAHALVDRVLSGLPGVAEKYIDFLKAGGSMYPIDALKMAGVDLTTPEPVEKAFKVMASYVDRLEELVG